MARFRLKPTPVEAVQLRWDTWSEMCELIGSPGGLKEGNPEGCYVDADGNITEDTNGRIGLRIHRKPDGEEIAVQDDLVVRMNGELVVYKPALFATLFESHADYKVDYEPDWKKYPRLAYRLQDSADQELRKELRVLLTDARADAAQYVHDVRVEELTRARDDERVKLRKRLLEVLGS